MTMGSYTNTEYAGISAPNTDSVGRLNTIFTCNDTIEYSTRYRRCFYLHLKKKIRHQKNGTSNLLCNILMMGSSVQQVGVLGFTTKLLIALSYGPLWGFWVTKPRNWNSRTKSYSYQNETECFFSCSLTSSYWAQIILTSKPR